MYKLNDYISTATLAASRVAITEAETTLLAFECVSRLISEHSVLVNKEINDYAVEINCPNIFVLINEQFGLDAVVKFDECDSSLLPIFAQETFKNLNYANGIQNCFSNWYLYNITMKDLVPHSMHGTTAIFSNRDAAGKMFEKIGFSFMSENGCLIEASFHARDPETCSSYTAHLNVTYSGNAKVSLNFHRFDSEDIMNALQFRPHSEYPISFFDDIHVLNSITVDVKQATTLINNKTLSNEETLNLSTTGSFIYLCYALDMALSDKNAAKNFRALLGAVYVDPLEFISLWDYRGSLTFNSESSSIQQFGDNLLMIGAELGDDAGFDQLKWDLAHSTLNPLFENTEINLLAMKQAIKIGLDQHYDLAKTYYELYEPAKEQLECELFSDVMDHEITGGHCFALDCFEEEQPMSLLNSL
jgi:hypothetical protein